MPEDGNRCQLIGGELHTTPAPNIFHQEISRNIGVLIVVYLKLNRLGKLYYAPTDVFLDDFNVFHPDLLFVSSENAHRIQQDGVHGAPDLVIEILSPSTARQDLGPKKRLLALHGGREFWAVLPMARKVEVYDLPHSETEPVATWQEGARFESKLLPGLELNVAEFFVV